MVRGVDGPSYSSDSPIPSAASSSRLDAVRYHRLSPCRERTGLSSTHPYSRSAGTALG